MSAPTEFAKDVALSTLWRTRGSTNQVLELKMLLENFNDMVRLFGHPEYQVIYSGMENAPGYTDFAGKRVGIDWKHIIGDAEEYPVPPERVDAILGILMHEIGHVEKGDPWTQQLIKTRPRRVANRTYEDREITATVQRPDLDDYTEFANQIMMDINIDTAMIRETPLRGAYIVRGRRASYVEQRPRLYERLNDYAMPLSWKMIGHAWSSTMIYYDDAIIDLLVDRPDFDTMQAALEELMRLGIKAGHLRLKDPTDNEELKKLIRRAGVILAEYDNAQQQQQQQGQGQPQQQGTPQQGDDDDAQKQQGAGGASDDEQDEQQDEQPETPQPPKQPDSADAEDGEEDADDQDDAAGAGEEDGDEQDGEDDPNEAGGGADGDDDATEDSSEDDKAGDDPDLPSCQQDSADSQDDSDGSPTDSPALGDDDADGADGNEGDADADDDSDDTNGVTLGCHASQGNSGEIDQSLANAVFEAIEKQLEDISEKVDVPHSMMMKPDVDLSVTSITTESSVSQLAEAVEIFREMAQQRTLGLTRGKLSNLLIDRLVHGDTHIFERHDVISDVSLKLGVSIDASSSISTTQWELMKEVVDGFVNAFGHRHDIDLVINAYCSKYDPRNGWGGCMIYRLFEPGWDFPRLKDVHPDGSTPSLPGMKMCHEQMQELGDQRLRNLMIHVTDGDPNVGGYGRDVREWVEDRHREGIEVVGIGVGRGVREASMQSQYRSYIMVETFDELPDKLKSLMVEVLTA